MQPIPAAPKTRFRAEREFGLIVGAVFTLIGGIGLYLGRLGSYAPIKLGAGVLLILCALLIPRALVYPRRGWMTIGEFIFSLITKTTLAILFFVVFAPVGLFMRWRGWDPLQRRADSSPTYWNDYSERQTDPRHYEKMY